MRARWLVFFSWVVAASIPLIAHPQSRGRQIQVLLKNGPGAPTPEEVVSYYNAWPRVGTPPLQALTKEPEASGFLLPDRASGDFLAWLQSNPNSARNKLEAYLLMTFPSVNDIPEALAALLADPNVDEAAEPPAMEFHTAESGNTSIRDVLEHPESGDQYGWDDMSLAAAWAITGGGYALIGQVDAGLDTDHPGLRQFSGSTYVGGNFLGAASKDVGLTGEPARPGFDPGDVDEAKTEWIAAGACTPIDAQMSPTRLGHGTHVAGLLGANAVSGTGGVQGTCKHCGVAAYRTVFLRCFPDQVPPQIWPSANDNAVDRGKVEATDAGAQVISMSYGHNYGTPLSCVTNRSKPACLTLAYGVGRDVALVASSGNKRLEIDFPASDKRVISAGGFQPDLAFWNDSPVGNTTCPPAPGSAECGSNFSHVYNGTYLTHQELLGSAKHVLSTTYPNTTWVDYAECGDGYGTPMGDGVGWCTGTSMSAPQIAGAIGVLRSVNPLVAIGVPEPPVGTPPGIRAVLAQSASQAAIGQAWDPRVGYGIPDVAGAVRRLLGKVAGGGVRNRATPLFRFYSAYAKDFAETTSPQTALSLSIAQVHDYVQPANGLGAAPVVPGYAFPYDIDDPNDAYDTYESPSAAPRASIYVLTTYVKPRAEWPALVPLYLMDKPTASGLDYLLVTTTADIEAAHVGGYDLRTIQGFVFTTCAPEPACVPPGAEALYRECNTANADCATFLESERAAFEANGYTAAYPPGGATKLGYAYPATDSDGDGLADGFEYVIGTSPEMPDSDFDGASDADEFPLAGVPVSDPCAGGVGAILCPADRMFGNGFEES
ncbi:MAG: S8 family serine peptidase [Rhodanobacteraceae bacterium]